LSKCCCRRIAAILFFTLAFPPFLPAYAGKPVGIVEFDIPGKAGSTHEIAAGPDGNLWITQQKQARIVKVSTEGKLVIVPFEKNSGPHGIAFDAAGRLWITLEFNNHIAQLDPRGKVVWAKKIPGPACGPHGLAVGGDGRTIWFTCKRSAMIGRLDPDSGALRLIAMEKGSQPIYLIGLGNEMWFTALRGNFIGRVNPEGTITTFRIPTRNSRPITITAGRDGTLWFSQESGSAFAKLDAQGRITEYKVPTKNAELAGLTHDSEGQLWLTYR
jgi:virginiamycin B lyase